MTDLLTATQDAVFAALSAAIPSSLCPVFQHVPENMQPPFMVIGDIEAEPGSTKGAELHTVEVYYFHRGKGRRPLLAMMHAGRDALDGKPITAAGATFEAPKWQGSAAGAADDGITYGGSQSYEIEAEPA